MWSRLPPRWRKRCPSARQWWWPWERSGHDLDHGLPCLAPSAARLGGEGKKGRARGARACDNGGSNRGGRSSSGICERNRGSGEMSLPPLYIPPGNPSNGFGRSTYAPFPSRFPTTQDVGAEIQALTSCCSGQSETDWPSPYLLTVMTGCDKASGSDA